MKYATIREFLTALLFTGILFIIACSGSDLYQGNWKATDSEGKQYEINFSPKTLTVKDMEGKVKTYEYSQNAILIENSTRTYGITLSDGRSINVFFPIAGQTDKGMITLKNNIPMYTISRTDYMQYQDFYKLTD